MDVPLALEADDNPRRAVAGVLAVEVDGEI